MDRLPEGMRFLRHELRDGRQVAVFRLERPGPDHEARRCDETAFDRASLELRLRNLRAAGRDAPETAAALAGWPGRTAGPEPDSGTADPVARVARRGR